MTNNKTRKETTGSRNIGKELLRAIQEIKTGNFGTKYKVDTKDSSRNST